ATVSEPVTSHEYVQESAPVPATASEPVISHEYVQESAPAPATASEPVLSMVSHPPLQTWHPPLLPDMTGDTTRYGPFPKSVSLPPATQDASTKHMSMPQVEMDKENTVSRMAVPADIKKEPSSEPKGGYTSTKAAKPDHIITDMVNIRSQIMETAPRSDEPSIMASALKSQQLSSTLPAQQASVSPSSSAMTLPHMTDTDHHGGFSGQQHNGQQNNQQNPQQGQADTMLDTRMGLDQGKDGRLLRLNMNDANWTDRLLRNIQSETGEGGDETIRVILEPARLGRLTVQVNITGNNTNVQITSVTAEAAAILADAEPRLQQVFEQHGLKLGQMQTSMGQGFSNQWSQGQGANSSERNHKTGTNNTAQDEEESTKILENAKTGQVNILA
ncbi:MAG: flagellar hook-length control protein FliK, partial [Candidatus Puniceispirillales bacterium]